MLKNSTVGVHPLHQLQLNLAKDLSDLPLLNVGIVDQYQY